MKGVGFPFTFVSHSHARPRTFAGQGWAEAVATIFTVLTMLMMMNQIGLHLTYSEHPGIADVIANRTGES